MKLLCVAVMAAVAISRTGCWARPGHVGSASPTTTPHRAGPIADDGVTNAPPDSFGSSAGGNRRIHAFDEAKRELAHIYAAAGQHLDLYCGCTFEPLPGHGMRVDVAACGYVPARDLARAERIEWEHAVPASAFGHTFSEWRDGDPRCVDSHGKRFHGRKCARLASTEFARMEADLHNLFPVVGEVNALRSDLPMGVLGTGGSASGSFQFGACRSLIQRGVFLPRPEVRGDLARAYKYMDGSYPNRRVMDDAHKALFDAWDAEDPPDAWERERNRRIQVRQGNPNEFIRD